MNEILDINSQEKPKREYKRNSQTQEQSTPENVGKIVQIKSCHSILKQGPLNFSSSKLMLKILKDKKGSYVLPAKNPKEFVSKYPSIASRFTKTIGNDVVYNKEEIEQFIISIPGTGMTLDTNDDMDKFIYDTIKLYPEIGTNVNPSNNKQLFYIIDSQNNAQSKTSQSKIKYDAQTIFYKLSKQDKIWFNSYLGYSTINVSSEIIDSNLLEYIEKNAEKFIEIYTDMENLRLYGDVRRMIEYKIIERKGTYYYFGDSVLGSSVEGVVEYLNQYKNSAIKTQLLSKLPQL